MFWALDTDDFEGLFCGDGDFPLINAVIDQFAAPVVLKRPIPTKNDTKFTTGRTTIVTSRLKSPAKVKQIQQKSTSVLDGVDKVNNPQQQSLFTKDTKTLSKELLKSKQIDSHDRNVMVTDKVATDAESKQGQGGGKHPNNIGDTKRPVKEKTGSVNNKDAEVAKTKKIKSVAKPMNVDNSKETKDNNKPVNGNPPKSIEKGVASIKASTKKDSKSIKAQAKSRKRPRPKKRKRKPKTGRRRRKQWRRRRPPVNRRRKTNNTAPSNTSKANGLKALKSKSIKEKQTSPKATTPSTIKPQPSTRTTISSTNENKKL